jgi:hypothetical protein
MPVDPFRRPLLVAFTAATLACGTIPGGRSLAGPLALDALPAATTAVVHVDVEAMMQSDPLRRAAAEALKTWAQQLPIDLQKDVLDATVIDDMRGLRIRLSPTARKRIEDFLAKHEPDQVRLNYGKHVVHVSGEEPSAAATRPATGKKRTQVPPVEDGEGVMVFQFGTSGVGFEESNAVQASAMPTFASFLDDQTLLVANDVRSLTRLLDVADGKTPSLADKGGDVWKTRAKAPEGTWITSIGLGNFLQGGAANTGVDGPLGESVASLTKDIKGGWCYIGESKPDHLFAECHVETAKPEAARQAKAVVDGFKALMLFSDEDAAQFSKALESTIEGDDMILKWRCPTAELPDIMEFFSVVTIDEDAPETPLVK